MRSHDLLRRPMNDIRHDMSQFYPMKATLEQLFGHRCYMKLKESADLNDWKHEIKRLLRAIKVAVDTTVQIADQEWRSEVSDIVQLGQNHVDNAKSISDLFAHLSSTLTRLVFLQLGHIPNHQRAEVVPFIAKNWQLDGFRSVQYVQSSEQALTVKSAAQRRESARKATSTQPFHAASPL